MGAYLRFFERRTERRFAEEAARGVVPPSVAQAAAPDPRDAKDRRRLIPPLGLREYWYPALPARRVKRSRPLYWRMLGEELALFRAADGSVAAVSDICPHRGASMSRGRCFYRGTISCPYHGATFDAEGACRAFLPEGPESRMPGELRVRTYPTRVLRGWVFVWMGEGAPAPIEEDLPPELFEGDAPRSLFLTTYTYWRCNWMLAIENQSDAHNYFYAHRNAVLQLTRNRSRPRTPNGGRARIVNGRTLIAEMKETSYYADAAGREPYQLYYPGVDGHWPIGQWRRVVWALFAPWYRLVYNRWRKRYRSAEEWDPTVGGWHLPSAVRINLGYYALTRFAVPVTADVSRIVYFHHRPRARSALGRLVQVAWYWGYFNWWFHYNFSSQDGAISAPCRYWTEEHLSSTDSYLVALRRLIVEGSRDAALRKARAAAERPPVAAAGP